MEFLRKNWSNLLLLLVIILLIVPQSRRPIQVGILRVFAFGPEVEPKKETITVKNYNWDLYDLNADAVSFEKAKGEVAIVNLWATWCPPCIAEMPSFQKLYKDYGNRVHFYFVSSEKKEVLQKFLEKHHYTFPVVRPGSSAPGNLISNVLPTTFVIAPSGEILIKKTGAADWNDADFRKLLDEMLIDKTTKT